MKQTIHGGRVLCLYRKTVSFSIGEIVRVLEKYFGYDLLNSEVFENYYDFIEMVKT